MEQETTLAAPSFIYVCCQQGVESVVKAEIAANHPGLAFAFSRPGFVTFKLAADLKLPLKYSLSSTFVRSTGWSSGRSQGDDGQAMVDQVVASPAAAKCRHLHVWQRDAAVPGQRGFEPGETPLAKAVAEQIAASKIFAGRDLQVNRSAGNDELVLDVAIVEPNQWWFGFHYASTVPGRWPGGVPFIDTGVEVASRAYFKIREALLWSGISIQQGDVCAEIGSAPGGACQWLLEVGATVIGVDPAEMEPEILKHDNFTHIRRRSNEVKKKDLKDVKWLFADLNATPTYTLDAISEIVSNQSVDVTGMILTLKMTDIKMAEEVTAIRKRVTQLGFSVVKTRQLAFNRGEFCLAAVKDKFALRSTRKKPKPTSG
jgi:23S rRNA (cytidine2498-2'-O)-methyltransferase